MLLCSKEHDKTIDSLCLDLGSWTRTKSERRKFSEIGTGSSSK